MRSKVIYSYTRLRAALIGQDPKEYAKKKNENVMLTDKDNAISICDFCHLSVKLSYPFTLTQFCTLVQFAGQSTPLPSDWYIPKDTDASKDGFQVWVAEKLFATVDNMHEAHQLQEVYTARLRDNDTEATITIRLHEENPNHD